MKKKAWNAGGASAVIGLVILLALLGACTGKSQSAKAGKESSPGNYPGTFTIGLSSWIGYAPLFVALEKGFFEKNGLQVEIQKIESGSDRRSAIAANRIQGMASTVDAVVIAVANGIPITQVLALDMSNGGDGLVAKKEYNSLQDLRGKKIALDTSGVASYFWFHVLLKEAGLSIGEFDVQAMGAGDAGAAFVAGRVDAALTWQPWLTRASETSFGKVLISSAESPGVITDSLSVRRDIIAEYPAATQAIVNGWMEAVEYTKTNPQDANEIMARAMGQTVEDFEATLPDVLFYDNEGNIAYLGSPEQPGEINEILEMASELWVTMGEIPAKPDIASLVDYSFVNK
jgi:NitT/TauT family transport system substrate-binding protein